MAYNASFAIATSINAASFTIVDTTTGSDGNITGRTIGLYKTDNTLYVPLITWPIGSGNYVFNGLTSDVALNIVVNVTSSSPLAPPSNYVYSLLFAFTQYGENFNYTLIQNQTSNPNIILDKNYYQNRMILRVELDSAKQAISLASDAYGSEACINRYNFMIANKNNYF